VIPFSRCSRWIKSRMLFCRSVSILASSFEPAAKQVQMNMKERPCASASNSSVMLS
jgi:hypothetical protein